MHKIRSLFKFRKIGLWVLFLFPFLFSYPSIGFAQSSSLNMSRVDGSLGHLIMDGLSIPFYPLLDWSNQTTELRTLSLEGYSDPISINGSFYKSDPFIVVDKPPIEIINFYYPENIIKYEWNIVGFLDKPNSVGMMYQHTQENRYMVVFIEECPANNNIDSIPLENYCVKVWVSDNLPTPNFVQPYTNNNATLVPLVPSLNFSNPLPVPFYSQRNADPSNNITLGFGSSCTATIHDYGCVLTAHTMIYDYYQANYTTVTGLNDSMKVAPGVYSCSGNCCNLWPISAPDAPSGVSFGQRYTNNCTSSNCIDSSNVPIIDNEINSGRPMHVRVHPVGGSYNSHSVVIIGHSGSDYYIKDPWATDDTQRTLTNGALGQYVVDFIDTINGTPPNGGSCSGPSLLSPSDGYISNSQTVLFSWNAPSGCTFSGYTFRVKDTSNMETGGTTLFDEGQGGTSVTKTFGNEWKNKDLYWGVRTANPLSPNWSVRRFRIEDSPQTCPTSGGVILYWNANYDCTNSTGDNGYRQRTSTGWQNVSDGTFNDKASSVRIPSGWSVKLFQNGDRGLPATCRNGDDNDFSGDTYDGSTEGLNDSVSSIEVFNIPNCGITLPDPNFDAWPVSGTVPLTVSFRIVNTANITSCLWNYGDGQTGTSCLAYHDHVYNSAGTYNVTLSVTGPGGSNSLPRNGYITVNNLIPTLTTLNPSSATAGGAAFTLTVTGTNFINGSVVRWNGSARTTTYVSATQLTATITAADINSTGTTPVTVFNPNPGGGTSGAVNFTTISSCTNCYVAETAWPMYRQNLQHTGRSTFNGPTQPGILWDYDANSYDGTAPVIGPNGNIYVGLGNSLFAFSSTGTILWNYETDGTVKNPAVAQNGTIYFGNYDGKVYAINPNGTLKWSFTTGSWIQASPTIAPDGTVYIGSSDTYFYAINPDGTQKWRFEVGSWLNSSAALDASGNIFFGSTTSYVYSLSASGVLRWSYQTGTYIDASPAVASDGTVYIGSLDNVFYAFNPNGTLKWSYTTGGEIISSPAIASDGTIYVGSKDNRLYAFNSIGTVRWSYLTGDDVINSPAIGQNGTIYFASQDEYLYSLAPTGTLNWQFRIGSSSQGPIIPSNTALLVNSGGHFYSITGNNPVPTLNTLSPSSGTVGGTAFTLTVTGTNFINGSVVRWNGSVRTTTYVSATQLTAAITAADIASGGTIPITVFNPTPGGGTSSAVNFTVNTPTHTVTFTNNGGTGTMSPQTANIPTALTLNTFTRSGYNFAGWNTAANGSGTAYANGATYSFAADVTLYAQWTTLPNHTVTFTSNGGAGTMSPQTANVPTALTLNTFTRSGYNFAGWNTAANGSGTAYANGATYSFAADVTLYAQWTTLPNQVSLAVVPPSPVTLGQNFDLVLEVRAGTQSVDGACTYLNFNTTYLNVVSITPGSTLPNVLVNNYDPPGQVNFCAGTLSNFPTGTFTLATITFHANAVTASTPLTYSTSAPRKSDVTFSGNSILGTVVNGTVEITNPTTSIQGTVTLQGRPTPPHARWSVPLNVTLTVSGNGTPVYTFTPTTDTSGHFSLTGIAPGTYDVWVKHSHTLQNLKTVTLAAGNNAIDFGVLLEGDARNDNDVSLTDFSVLATTYGKCEGTAGYDGRADFNGDTCIDLLDFSRLASNFGRVGPITTTGLSEAQEPGLLTADPVEVVVDPLQSNVQVGDTFTVSIKVQSGTQLVDGAQISLDFDPTKLKVKSLHGNTTAFPSVLLNTFDNTSGQIDYAAGALSNFPNGTVELVEIEFEAIGGTTSTPLTFHYGQPSRTTIVTYGGNSVLTGDQDGLVKVDFPFNIFLPNVIR